MNLPPLTPPVALVANGPFPDHPVPQKIISQAKTRIAVDGGNRHLEKLRCPADLILGDLDSAVPTPGIPRIELEDQSRTDLDKALDWCLRQKITSLDLVAAFGNRDDHSLANYLLLVEYGHRCQLTAYSDFAKIQPLFGSASFASFPGQIVSILSLSGNPRITTDGLQYNLNDESLEYISQGVSNRAVGSQFNITVDNGPILVFRFF